MFRFERLRVWHKAVELFEVVDSIAEVLPPRYAFIADQLRRAALSVSSNIAEGAGRETLRESRYFYTLAKGSAFEIVSIALVCCRRKLMYDDQRREVYARVEDIAKMLSGLKRVGAAPSRLAAHGSRLENG